MDAKSNLYGTTSNGGEGAGKPGGMLYELTPDRTEIPLVYFSWEGDYGGYDPMAGVIRDAKGNLYGTLPALNHIDGCYGSVWKLTF
jgi:hypothetical protein